jgi:hypothetical protein
MQPAAIWW